jgi:hypothetical protein
MSDWTLPRTLRVIAVAAAGAVVESACVWVLTRVTPLPSSMTFAVAFAAGYVTVVSVLPVVGPSQTKVPLGTRLLAYGLFALAALLVVEATIYFCDGLLSLGLLKTNLLVLIAVACWVALGWRVMGGDAHGQASGLGEDGTRT